MQTSYVQTVLGLIPELAASAKLWPAVQVQLGIAYFWHANPVVPWQTHAAGDTMTAGPADSYSGAEYRLKLIIGP